MKMNRRKPCRTPVVTWRISLISKFQICDYLFVLCSRFFHSEFLYSKKFAQVRFPTILKKNFKLSLCEHTLNLIFTVANFRYNDGHSHVIIVIILLEQNHCELKHNEINLTQKFKSEKTIDRKDCKSMQMSSKSSAF